MLVVVVQLVGVFDWYGKGMVVFDFLVLEEIVIIYIQVFYFVLQDLQCVFVIIDVVDDWCLIFQCYEGIIVQVFDDCFDGWIVGWVVMMVIVVFILFIQGEKFIRMGEMDYEVDQYIWVQFLEEVQYGKEIVVKVFWEECYFFGVDVDNVEIGFGQIVEIVEQIGV